MIDVTETRGLATASRYDQLHFGIIRVVHETIAGMFVNPYSRLVKAGLKSDQQVLEVGCGPGFFTIPAARIVGGEGHVYALDINPAAVEHVKRKIALNSVTNVDVRLADAGQTGLPEKSIDVAFLFSVVRALKDMDKILNEMHRVLKTTGLLSVQSALPEKKLLAMFTAKGLFTFRNGAKRLFIFEKRETGLPR